jgi:bifunctional non-homologous end joining protein LigD
MLATLADAPRVAPGLAYEPKYDGIRAIVELERLRPARGAGVPNAHACALGWPVGGERGPSARAAECERAGVGPREQEKKQTPGARGRRSGAGGLGPEVRIWSRLGNEKTSQFPELVRALERAARVVKTPLVVDGEIVALDPRGRPAGFQRLQGRMHLTGAGDIERMTTEQPVAFIAFDLLREGDEDLRPRPWSERRQRLEARLARVATEDGPFRLSEVALGDGRALEARASKEGWEGLVAKDVRAPYQSGRRSPAWRKLKLVQRQEFVVGGWTEPRQTRSAFGALLLGVSRGGRLEYVGHVGTGFDEKELARVHALLKARETPTSPFATPIKTNEPAHWARPELVAEVKFTEWTDEGYLRHPVYLGLRDDKRPSEVRVEAGGRGPEAGSRVATSDEVAHGFSRATQQVIDQLQALEDARRDGTIELPNGDRLKVTNLAKVFWPDGKITKGELLRYYAQVAPFILPVVEDRPLVMKRFPNGVTGEAFYQQRSRVEQEPPAGVRVEILPDELDPIGEPKARRFVGGSLTTLLYMTQIAAISQDPWFSRVQSPLDADHVAIDLDPGEETTFAKVLDVARWVRDELAAVGVPGFPKTSGSRGLHVYVPLLPGTSYESGLLFCQIVATLVASKHPKIATIERTVRARPRGTVYIDYLQNILGKTLATAYSARATAFAGVSTPLTWEEVDEGIDPRDFTVRTAPARFARVGDLWARLRTSKPADLASVIRRFR